MKKYFFLFFFLLLFVSGIGITLITVDSINFAKKELNKIFFQKRIEEYEFFFKEKKNYIFSIAEYISTSSLIKKAYKQNELKFVYNELKNFFVSLNKRGLLSELHFFRNFENFADFPSKNRILKKIILNFKNPAFFYFTNKNKVFLVFVYPFKISDIKGEIVFIEDVALLIKMFKNLGAKEVAISTKSFLIGDKIDFNNFIVTKIPLYGSYKNKVAEILIADDYKPLFYKILMHVAFYIGIFIFIMLAMLFFNIALLNYIIKELNKTAKYLTYIKTQQFNKLPENIDIKNEIHIHQQAIIEAAKEIKTFIDILKAKKENFYKKAYIDALTSAFNRRFLEEKEHEFYLKGKALDKNIVVLMFDIDNFKKINDTYGHQIGDLVLKEIGDIIKNNIRENDVFIRYGGEEFLVILEDVTLKDAIKIAEKIRKAIENTIIKAKDKEIKVTISIGISEFKKNDKDFFEVIKRADEKLYKAKKSGKNRWEV